MGPSTECERSNARSNLAQVARWPSVLAMTLSLIFVVSGPVAAQKAVGCSSNDDCHYQVLLVACKCTGDNCRWEGAQVNGHDYEIDEGPNKFCYLAHPAECSCNPCASPSQTCTISEGLPPDLQMSIDGLPIAEFFVDQFLSLIPEGGGELASLFDSFLFPAWEMKDSTTVWDQIKPKVEALVNTEIAEKEMALLEETLNGLGVAVQDFSGIPDKTSEQAQSKIISIQTTVETAACQYIEKGMENFSQQGPLLFLSQVASMHLAIQFETLRVLRSAGKPDNDRYNKAVLLGLISQYSELAARLSASARDWRLGQVSSELEEGSNANGSVGGRYFAASDKLNPQFGLRYFSCYQQQTGGWAPQEVPVYSCWPVCAVNLAAIKADAHGCLVKYRNSVGSAAESFWASHLGDFAAQWAKLEAQADQLIGDKVEPMQWSALCGGGSAPEQAR